MSVRKSKKSRNQLHYFDWFTAGHFLFGFITYILSFFILRVSFAFTFDNALFGSLIVVAFIGLIWEFLENFVIRFIKHNGKVDCLKNALTDILFDLLGGIFAWILIYFIQFFGTRL
jgi:Co/Zn/Cd efflux system component